jgi:hypothetical protein
MTTKISGRVVKIGNSQGIRIPKLLLEQSGIQEKVNLEARNGQIAPVLTGTKPLQRWLKKNYFSSTKLQVLHGMKKNGNGSSPI